MQKDKNIKKEANKNWDQLTTKEIDFCRIEDKIDALMKVTPEQVNELFIELFFKNPRRLQLKIHSHAHRDDTETRAKCQALNKEFY